MEGRIGGAYAWQGGESEALVCVQWERWQKDEQRNKTIFRVEDGTDINRKVFLSFLSYQPSTFIALRYYNGTGLKAHPPK